MSQERVLAIEHDWRMRKLIRANLEPLGMEVREAVDAQHGLRLLAESRPDLILLDLELPGTDALHLLKLLLASLDGGSVRIVATSAEPLDRRILCPEQVTSHLQKPFAVSALLRHVREALGSGKTGA
jgi:two-component system KDP operon response regulator KdpE